MTEDEITLFLAEEINGSCISQSPIGYDKCRAIAKRFLQKLENTSSNSDYAKCYNCGKMFEIEKELCKECSDFGDGCGA